MSKEIYFRQPKMWKTFRCLGNECPASCCDRGWDICWYDSEISAVMNADIPDEIKAKCREAFEPAKKEGQKKIVYDSEGRCPFHDKESGLCMIQKNMGLEGLGLTCRIFPRIYIFNGGMITRTLVPSCSAVVRTLVEDEHALETEVIQSRNKNAVKDLNGFDITRECMPNAPVTYPKLFDVISGFYGKLFTSGLPFDTTMIHGTLAAANIAAAFNKGKASAIPSMLTELLKQADSEKTKAYSESVTPDLQSALRISGAVIDDVMSRSSFRLPMKEFLGEDFSDTSKYVQSLEKLKSALENYDSAMKNIALSLLNYTLATTLTLENKTVGLKDFFGIYTHSAVLTLASRTYMACTVYSGETSLNGIASAEATLNTHFLNLGMRMPVISEQIKKLGIDSLEKFVRMIK